MARGREADSPTELPKIAWKDVLLRVKEEIGADQIGLIAAGIAFYGLLALFPAVTAMVAIAGLITEPSLLVEEGERLAAALPDQAAEIIIGQLKEVAGSHEGGLGLAAFFGIIVAVFSASKGVDNMMRGLNVAYEEEEKRGFFHRKLVVLGLTLAFLVGLLLCVGIIAALPVALAFVEGVPLVEDILTVARWPALLALGFGGIMLLYRYGPSRDPAKWRWLAPGALAACVLWVIGTLGFALYVRYFGSYNETFGALGGVIVLLMWLWLSAYILLIGAELDAELEAQTKRDTTVGRREPMGERGAVKADKLGAAQA